MASRGRRRLRVMARKCALALSPDGIIPIDVGASEIPLDATALTPTNFKKYAVIKNHKTPDPIGKKHAKGHQGHETCCRG